MIIIGIYVSIGLIMPTGVFEWYQMVLIITLICLFWYKGKKISHRKMSYKSTCNHFDLGISLLFVLLIIKFLVQLKAGIKVSEPFTLYCIIFYFFPGLTAIFLSNNTTNRGKRYSKGFQIYGVLLSSLTTLIFCSMAVFLILLPFMTSFAESGYTVLKQTTNFLSPYFYAILKFIFSIPNNPVSNNTTSQNKTIANIDVIQTHGQTGLEVFVYYGIMIFMIAAFIFLIGYIIFVLFKFLMSKQTPTTQINIDKTPLFSRLLRWLVFFFSTLKKTILSLTEKVEDAKKGFKKLVLWGKRSGMPIL